MDKSALISAIIGELESNRAVLISAAKASKDEATDQESRQEGKFDMRAQSAAYVAAGQARLVAELGAAIAAYHNLSAAESPAEGIAGIGSVVTLECRGQKTVYFIGPTRGGIDVDIGGVPVTVITALSPLGRRLVGRRAGDSFKVAESRFEQTYLVARID